MVTSPEATLKTVFLRLGADCSSGALLAVCLCEEEGWAVGGGGGGGTEKSARSWDSVSRMREVMSWLERRALVKIFGGGKLDVCQCGPRIRKRKYTHGRESMP